MIQLTLGEKIKKYRKALHLTQKELAQLVNLSEKTISAYETNKNEPDIAMIHLLAEALKVNTVEFIEDKPVNHHMLMIQIHPDSYEDLLKQVMDTCSAGKIFNFRGTTIENVEDGLSINHYGQEYTQSFYDGALNIALGFHNIMTNDHYRKQTLLRG